MCYVICSFGCACVCVCLQWPLGTLKLLWCGVLLSEFQINCKFNGLHFKHSQALSHFVKLYKHTEG